MKTIYRGSVVVKFEMSIGGRGDVFYVARYSYATCKLTITEDGEPEDMIFVKPELEMFIGQVESNQVIVNKFTEEQTVEILKMLSQTIIF